MNDCGKVFASTSAPTPTARARRGDARRTWIASTQALRKRMADAHSERAARPWRADDGGGADVCGHSRPKHTWRGAMACGTERQESSFRARRTAETGEPWSACDETD